MISSLIFTSPYSDGNPLVLVTDITVSSESIDDESVVVPVTTSGTKLSDFKYWSKLLIKFYWLLIFCQFVT